MPPIPPVNAPDDIPYADLTPSEARSDLINALAAEARRAPASMPGGPVLGIVPTLGGGAGPGTTPGGWPPFMPVPQQPPGAPVRPTMPDGPTGPELPTSPTEPPVAPTAEGAEAVEAGEGAEGIEALEGAPELLPGVIVGILAGVIFGPNIADKVQRHLSPEAYPPDWMTLTNPITGKAVEYLEEYVWLRTLTPEQIGYLHDIYDEEERQAPGLPGLPFSLPGISGPAMVEAPTPMTGVEEPDVAEPFILPGSTIGERVWAGRPTREAQRLHGLFGWYLDPFTNEIVFVDYVTQADHIFPDRLIRELPGFKDLTPEQQKELVDYPGNFQPLPHWLNASKWAWSYFEWVRAPIAEGVATINDFSAEYIEYMQALTMVIVHELQEMIEGFLKNNLKKATKMPISAKK